MMEVYNKTITKEEIREFPFFAYEGEVIVIEKESEVTEAVDYLSAHTCLGFDTETRPSFRKGEFHSVSLLQLAAEERVYLFRLNKCGFPVILRKLLGEAKVMKVGVGIRDDLKALLKLGNFEPAAFVDLQEVAPEYGIAEKSFSKLMAIIFQVRISKRQQTSNWEINQLSESQIKYAATDAWGSLQMYRELKEHWK